MAQIVDENAKISEGLDQYIESIGVEKVGTDYHMISIIGPQSSGKSTLLNNLFGTEFAVMNESTGRQQTTKGIHASFRNNILIFDIEGSDSRERGDADSLFERKAALFALAMSDVVMVNMWIHDVGRFQASSLPLLKTVFEVNFQLFSKSSEARCHLVFVVRDMDMSLCEQIKKQVYEDLMGTWNSVIKPPSLSNAPFENYFIFHFFPMPHFRIAFSKFQESAKQLADEFTNPENDHYLFAEPTGKVIPGDGLVMYIKSVWDAISNNKELNMPSQRRALSNFKCEAFMKEAEIKFVKKAFEQIGVPISAEKKIPLPNFKEISQNLIQESIMFYDKSASKYVTTVVDEFREKLRIKLGSALWQYYQITVKNFQAQTEQSFQTAIDGLPKDLISCTNWLNDANSALITAVNSVKKYAQEQMIEDGQTKFGWNVNLSNVEVEFRKYINDKLKDLIAHLHKQLFQVHIETYSPKVRKIISDAENKMWEYLRELMHSEIASLKNDILKHLKNNGIVQETLTVLVEQLQMEDPLIVCQKEIERETFKLISEQTSRIKQLMKFRFEEKFLKNESGKDRIWKDEDIPTIFESARQAGLDLLHLFSFCKLRDPNEKMHPRDLLSQRLLSPNIMESYEESFSQEIEKEYANAVTIRESMVMHINIPWPLWVILLMFSYDKFIWAFHHPLITIFILVFLIVLYYAYTEGYLNGLILKASHLTNFIREKTEKKQKPKKKKRTHHIKLEEQMKKNENKHMKPGLDTNDSEWHSSNTDKHIQRNKSSILNKEPKNEVTQLKFSQENLLPKERHHDTSNTTEKKSQQKLKKKASFKKKGVTIGPNSDIFKKLDSMKSNKNLNL